MYKDVYNHRDIIMRSIPHSIKLLTKILNGEVDYKLIKGGIVNLGGKDAHKNN